MQAALSQTCTLPAAFDDDLRGYADAAATAVEIWLTKLETHLETHSLDAVRALAEQRGLKLAAASYQGGLLVSQGEARREAWAQFGRRLDLCGELGIPVIVVGPDFPASFQQMDIDRAHVSLRQLGDEAQRRGVRVAFEFHARSPFLNNLETAASFVESVDHPHVGLCLDVFHFQVGPSKLSDLAYLSQANLFHVQACDLADRPRELATDADRIFPGDGDFPLGPIFEHLRRIGYAGCVSLELFNPLLWQASPQQVGELGLTALRKALGQAQSG